MIKPDSAGFKVWSKPPVTLKRKYYLFDVRNPIEVARGERPYLVERGPYVYNEVWERRGVEFLGDQIVTYKPVVTLTFDPASSNGTESDLISFLNVPAVVRSQKKASNLNNLQIPPSSFKKVIHER